MHQFGADISTPHRVCTRWLSLFNIHFLPLPPSRFSLALSDGLASELPVVCLTDLHLHTFSEWDELIRPTWSQLLDKSVNDSIWLRETTELHPVRAHRWPVFYSLQLRAPSVLMGASAMLLWSAAGQQMSRQVVISNGVLSLWLAEHLQQRQLKSGFLCQHFPSSQPPAGSRHHLGKLEHCCRLDAGPTRGLQESAPAKWAMTGRYWWNGESTCL